MLVLNKFDDTVSEANDYTILIFNILIVVSGATLSGAGFIWDTTGKKSDDSSWIAPFLLSIHIYDFASDILLSYTIWTAAIVAGLYFESTLLWLGIGSIATIVIPLAMNTFFAMKIQQ